MGKKVHIWKNSQQNKKKKKNSGSKCKNLCSKHDRNEYAMLHIYFLKESICAHIKYIFLSMLSFSFLAFVWLLRMLKQYPTVWIYKTTFSVVLYSKTLPWPNKYNVTWRYAILKNCIVCHLKYEFLSIRS